MMVTNCWIFLGRIFALRSSTKKISTKTPDRHQARHRSIPAPGQRKGREQQGGKMLQV
jgi:hypothetical protein